MLGSPSKLGLRGMLPSPLQISVGSYTNPSGSFIVGGFLSMVCLMMSLSSLMDTFSFEAWLFFLLDLRLYFSFSALIIFFVDSEGL